MTQQQSVWSFLWTPEDIDYWFKSGPMGIVRFAVFALATGICIYHYGVHSVFAVGGLFGIILGTVVGLLAGTLEARGFYEAGQQRGFFTKSLYIALTIGAVLASVNAAINEQARLFEIDSQRFQAAQARIEEREERLDRLHDTTALEERRDRAQGEMDAERARIDEIERLLEESDNRDAVRELQRLVGVNPDGVFGSRTANAARERIAELESRENTARERRDRYDDQIAERDEQVASGASAAIVEENVEQSDELVSTIPTFAAVARFRASMEGRDISDEELEQATEDIAHQAAIFLALLINFGSLILNNTGRGRREDDEGPAGLLNYGGVQPQGPNDPAPLPATPHRRPGETLAAWQRRVQIYEQQLQEIAEIEEAEAAAAEHDAALRAADNSLAQELSARRERLRQRDAERQRDEVNRLTQRVEQLIQSGQRAPSPNLQVTREEQRPTVMDHLSTDEGAAESRRHDAPPAERAASAIDRAHALSRRIASPLNGDAVVDPFGSDDDRQ